MTQPARPMDRAEAAGLLGVDESASPADVQRAFLRAARTVHPDVLPGADDAERRTAEAAFDRLLRARETLLRPSPTASVSSTSPTAFGPPRHGRDLSGSLVVLALMAFLLVLLVTVEQGMGGSTVAPGFAPPTLSTTAP